MRQPLEKSFKTHTKSPFSTVGAIINRPQIYRCFEPVFALLGNKQEFYNF